jgi:cytochrome c553
MMGAYDVASRSVRVVFSSGRCHLYARICWIAAVETAIIPPLSQPEYGSIQIQGDRNMSFLLRAIAISLVLVSLQSFAEGDAAAGQAKSAVCAACHGADGNSMVPNWPKLSGQHEQYLVRQVSLIQAGARAVPEMMAIVPGLSAQDIADLAAWFSTQTRSGGVADEATIKLGEQIFRAGNAESGVPACMSCHGPAGEGNPLAGYPALAGQHAIYTANILTRFRGGENWGDDDAPSQVMNGVAVRMTDPEIQAVASYIQGLYRRSE